jgi:ATP-dependent DNA helicase RecQ
VGDLLRRLDATRRVLAGDEPTENGTVDGVPIATDIERVVDDLVAAAVKLVSDRWRPDPAPTWVTAIPSLRHPALVGDYARRLADALGLPFHDVLAAAAVPPQKEMQNSAQQLRNVAASLRAIAECPTGPVLLVDDIVDSRWTLTYAGWLLRHHRAGPVHPFALATAAPQDDA